MTGITSKKKALAMAVACALAAMLFVLVGCGSSGSTKTKTYDFSSGAVETSLIQEAFSCDDIKAERDITIVGTYEHKLYSDGTGAHVIHMYIDGKDYQDSVYCDVSGIDASALPENGTMVKAHGIWKHDAESSNDTSFGYYVDKIEVVS